MWICATVHGNYWHTTYIKMVTNEGWYLTSRYAFEVIGSLVHKNWRSFEINLEIGGPLRQIYKTKGNHTNFNMDQTQLVQLFQLRWRNNPQTSQTF